MEECFSHCDVFEELIHNAKFLMLHGGSPVYICMCATADICGDGPLHKVPDVT